MTAPAPERLADLLAAVEMAEGPSRELDHLVHFVVVCPWLAERCVKWANSLHEEDGAFLWWDADRLEQKKPGWSDQWEPVTSSIDAALALVERVLPGKRVSMECGENYSSARFVKGWGGRKETGPTSERPANELPLCVIACLLRALITGATP